MKTIQLSQAKVSLVDDEVYNEVNQFKWSAVQPRGGTFYAVRSVYPGNVRVHLHRLVWERHNGPIPAKRYIDHINRNGLDNRLENLRLVTTAENMANRGPSKSNKLGERGISLQEGRYYVELYKNRKRIYRAYFKTLEEAKTARDNQLGVLNRVP